MGSGASSRLHVVSPPWSAHSVQNSLQLKEHKAGPISTEQTADELKIDFPEQAHSPGGVRCMRPSAAVSIRSIAAHGCSRAVFLAANPSTLVHD